MDGDVFVNSLHSMLTSSVNRSNHPEVILLCIFCSVLYVYFQQVSIPACMQIVTLHKKKFGCFNHRVVTMVADKLERQW